MFTTRSTSLPTPTNRIKPANLQMIEENDLDDLQTNIGKQQDKHSARQGYQDKSTDKAAKATLHMQVPTSPATHAARTHAQNRQAHSPHDVK